MHVSPDPYGARLGNHADLTGGHMNATTQLKTDELMNLEREVSEGRFVPAERTPSPSGSRRDRRCGASKSRRSTSSVRRPRAISRSSSTPPEAKAPRWCCCPNPSPAPSGARGGATGTTAGTEPAQGFTRPSSRNRDSTSRSSPARTPRAAPRSSDAWSVHSAHPLKLAVLVRVGGLRIARERAGEAQARERDARSIVRGELVQLHGAQRVAALGALQTVGPLRS